MEEYNKEAQDFTAKQLEELKVYCKSPDCNSWRVMSRLKRPDRYIISFIHINRFFKTLLTILKFKFL